MTGGLLDDTDLRTLADTIQINLRYDPKTRVITGKAGKMLKIGDNLAMPASVEVISAVASATAAAVLVSVRGDLGLFVVARLKGTELHIVDLGKLDDKRGFRGLGLFESLGTSTAREAGRAIDKAVVAVFEKDTGGAWKQRPA